MGVARLQRRLKGFEVDFIKSNRLQKRIVSRASISAEKSLLGNSVIASAAAENAKAIAICLQRIETGNCSVGLDGEKERLTSRR